MPTYNPWIEIARVSIQNPKLHKTKFNSWGDWTFSILEITYKHNIEEKLQDYYQVGFDE